MPLKIFYFFPVLAQEKPDKHSGNWKTLLFLILLDDLTGSIFSIII
ncbi:MAG: hypothetical protein GX226_04125 [Dehalococcoidales bacterium]|nr:hypothetical protein [Dehalococcoidales bacterium]